MNFYKKIILVLQMVLVVGWCGILTGCAGEGSLSLEEALVAKKQRNTDLSSGSDSSFSTGSERKEERRTDDGEESTEQLLYVYVCGSVVRPGVYALEEGSRIVAAVEAAGGFLEEAATESVNLAALLKDGMQIVIPDLEEAASVQVQGGMDQDGRVNLNRATVEDLCSLQGIGEAKAEAILAYREEIGAFTSVEQIQNVTGIGENLYKQIKESIYIE